MLASRRAGKIVQISVYLARAVKNRVGRQTRGIHTEFQPSPEDIVLTFARRTALTRAKKGLFKDTSSDQLLRSTLQTGLKLSGMDPALVEDIVIGTCHPPSPCYEARAAALAAGFPESTPVQTVNRLCGSGLMAIRHISDSIRAGDIDVGIAVGYESMSSHPRPTPLFADEQIKQTPSSLDCAKMLALEYDVSRAKQDHYGLLSHTRASHASRSGRFQDEIMAITTTVLSNPEDPSSSRVSVTVDTDDGIRHNATLEMMTAARPAFKGMGDERSTGPNSSQVTDGAAMAIMMRRSKAEKLGFDILATHLGTSVVGVSPRVMGIGPVRAIPAVLARANLTVSDVDLFEINEAFGSMYAYSVETLELDIAKVNVNGGAIMGAAAVFVV
ncbi:hypothetical protein CI109_104441 [Kwoniella shandongensis]|uniref:3-ketoacyl-CoA thiolase n=1 Tax=Kwoniella shandongensis TaxID=1734106 RepID=A0AAJ8LJU2_9TREE